MIFETQLIQNNLYIYFNIVTMKKSYDIGMEPINFSKRVLPAP